MMIVKLGGPILVTKRLSMIDIQNEFISYFLGSYNFKTNRSLTNVHEPSLRAIIMIKG